MQIDIEKVRFWPFVLVFGVVCFGGITTALNLLFRDTLTTEIVVRAAAIRAIAGFFFGATALWIMRKFARRN